MAARDRLKSDVTEAAGGDTLSRRDFLKLGAGFSAMLAGAGALGLLPGCGAAGRRPASGYGFLEVADVELFSALVPAVITDLAGIDAAQRTARLGEVLRGIDASCSALDLNNRNELRKLFDLLSVAPLRYVLAGVGSWGEASVEDLQRFLARWCGSRFAALNAGGIFLVKLVATSYYGLPAAWPATGYPGPLERVHRAVNS